MSLVLGTAHLQARLQASLDYLSIGGACVISIYTGPQPAFNGAVTTLLAQFTMSSPAGTIVGSATTSSLTLPSPVTVLASGTAVWARVTNGAGTTAFDTDVSGTGGTAAVRLSSLTFSSGDSATMTTATLG